MASALCRLDLKNPVIHKETSWQSLFSSTALFLANRGRGACLFISRPNSSVKPILAALAATYIPPSLFVRDAERKTSEAGGGFSTEILLWLESAWLALGRLHGLTAQPADESDFLVRQYGR